jgi:tyrosyl-tRNA synthetase
MYGRVMSWADGVLPVAFELCTKLPFVEVKQIQSDLQTGTGNPRDLKMKLAFEIVKINFDDERAAAAQDYFIRTVQKKEIPEDIEERKVKTGEYKFIDLLSELKMVESKSEARRLMEQGGIKLDNEAITDINYLLKVEDGANLLIQRGKRQFLRVIGE